jgi:hypothetical protein
MCGHCKGGRHQRCHTRRTLCGRPPPEPLAYLVGRDGGGKDKVWLANGRPCRWLCPCDCPINPPPKPVQLSLF